MNLRLNLVLFGIILILVMFCGAQERFDSGWLKGFTISPTEHIINQCEKPFTVRAVKGTVILEYGEGMPDVLLEIRDDGGHIRAGKTDSKGRFKLNGVGEGTYRFKATLNGYQSVVGTIVVSSKASRAQRINISMRLGG